MASIPVVLVGSLLGTLGLLIAYDPTPLCDFRDINHPRNPVDERGVFIWRCGGVAVSVVGIVLTVLAILV
ncbi:hypothetical protein ACH9L7_03380 [Haloferax sp. S1W]|uniref:hypothetical protein n=1 Tax=Haloferax sp. S1W TaxID=3377110 RepID=UPI0037C7510B